MKTRSRPQPFIVLHFYGFLLRVHCATRQKVAVSIPVGVIEIFHCQNTYGRTMTVGSTQPLREISTRNISWW